VSGYDQIARLYDPWSRSVVEDIGFYVGVSVESGGPVVELGVGTGRIAVPVASAGIRVIGVDTSQGMLDVAAEQAELAGLAPLVELRIGDMRSPPVSGTFPLVICPFRSLLHMETDADRRAALRAIHALVEDGGRFVFDVFTPLPDGIAETHGLWLEREPGIFERVEWDEDERTVIMRVRGDDAETALSLAWVSIPEWSVLLHEEGFTVDGLYGWFDRTRWQGHEDSIWVCSKRV
jgi:SAM-dependent methyltransferase